LAFLSLFDYPNRHDDDSLSRLPFKSEEEEEEEEDDDGYRQHLYSIALFLPRPLFLLVA